jgi:hypothetical protein
MAASTVSSAVPQRLDTRLRPQCNRTNGLGTRVVRLDTSNNSTTPTIQGSPPYDVIRQFLSLSLHTDDTVRLNSDSPDGSVTKPPVQNGNITPSSPHLSVAISPMERYPKRKTRRGRQARLRYNAIRRRHRNTTRRHYNHCQLALIELAIVDFTTFD